ncbi:MarR family winged helix-turn-helix transcriptional regulator [Pseudophaeobacter leonis]|uniref:MarR family winged helix-turn-helix transcriptional regulator n=1 Tax=Pseudophaeobacter leonis TaxID=1144477 RepID=UPI0009F54D9E|nr:MarR family transcriptional regulator [Pseudophaeobacter leonis]
MSKSESDLPKGIYEEIDFAVLLQIAGRMIAQHVEAIGKEVGLSAGHLSVLGMVHRKPGLVQNVYGSILAINDATLGRYVDKLVDHGLLQRTRSDEDRRTVRLTLTDAGLDYILTAKSRLAAIRHDIKRGLQDTDISQLEKNLITFLSAEGPDL